MSSQAGSIGSKVSETTSKVFSPIGTLISRIIVILFFAIIIVGLIIGGRLAYNYNKLGSADVAVKHGLVAAEKPAGILGKLAATSPELYALWTGKPYVDPFVAEVEKNEENPNLGVVIKEFKPVDSFFYENSDIKLTASIQASSLAEETKIAAFCSLEGFRNNQPVPAQLLGNTASGNAGLIFKNQPAEFQARCLFPPGAVKAEKLRNAAKATLIITYEFTTKGSQKMWFLDKQTILSLEGKDPFQYYGVSDSQLDSRRKIKSKSTDGPVLLAMKMDLPQPLSDENPYELSLQLSYNNLLRGTIEKLEYLTLQVPSVEDLDIILEGERGFTLPGSRCDFEYIGQGEEGFKQYQLRRDKLASVNKECNKETLSTLALSERECIDFFKAPTFSCLMKATKVPDGVLQFDNIRAEAKYIYRVTDNAVVEVRKSIV